MNIFELLERSKKRDSSLIIYSLLNRIPIFIIGPDAFDIDDLLIDFCDIISFRRELTFYNDFISKNEFENLLQNENLDFNTQRIQIRSPCSVSLKALKSLDDFFSFIIGIESLNKRDALEVLNLQVKRRIERYLVIFLYSNKVGIIAKGINNKSLDLDFEANILQKVSDDTEKAINKMKRVLIDKLRVKKIEQHLTNTLLDFEIEKNELKRNIMQKELQNFYSGSKRTFFILTRLKLLHGIGISSSIGSRTLLETIDYMEASINRILSFIKSEWGEDFQDLIESNKDSYIGDKIQALWG